MSISLNPNQSNHKNKRRVLCAVLATATLLGTVGCRSNRPPSEESNFDETTNTAVDTDTDTDAGSYNGEETTHSEDPADPNEVTIMQEIQYESTRNEQKSGDGVTLTLPAAETAVTGTRVMAYVQLTEQLEDYNYFIVDWGDGTWSYTGPYQSHQRGELSHTYKQPGTYQVKACGINLDAGRRKGWTEPQTLTVSGEAYSTADHMITTVTPIGSSLGGDAYAYAHIADGDNTTRWQSAQSLSVKANEYVGYIFDDTYTLDSLEIKFPADLEDFPSNISVEYTTDGGETWYMMPHYYYVLPNSEGYYDCFMGFPNPQGATLVLPMEGICANGVRLRALSYGRNGRRFGVDEMRVYGTKETRFYTSYEGHYNADLSNMFLIFGLAKTEPYVREDPFRAGEANMCGSLEWAAWDSIQLIWTGYEPSVSKQISAMKNAVYGGDGWYYDEATGKYVVDESEYATNPRNDGFIWATGGAPKHLDEQNHYTNNSSLIMAARDYILIAEPNEVKAFLESTNGRGQVMLDKLRKAMAYMLFDLNGESGLMTIYDPRNDGTVRGLSSNYWDSLNFFGYNSSYENIFFYEAVLAMADIETYLGNTAEADYYTALAAKIKTTFNDYFWDPVKGRYITSVNVKGDVLDFGLTMVNFMAVAAGLATPEQTQLIYDWVDGRRIIEGDNSTGTDIYNFKVSARTNTVAVETIEEDGLHYWWYNGHSFNDVLPGHWGIYGQQMQNGGTIFYTSYYDLVGRTYLSGDLAQERFGVIMDEFHIDSLRRDPRTQWGYYLVSINGEFPESGLVPASFVTQTVGITPDVAGLRIEACLPSDMTYAGVRDYHYNGKVYHIEVNRSLSRPSMTEENGIHIVKVPADTAWFITRDNQIIEAVESGEAPSVSMKAPVITPARQTVEADVLDTDLTLRVDYNNGSGATLTCNGTAVAAGNFTRGITTLTLSREFVRALPVGENHFTLSTSGGTATFVLQVNREGVLFTDTERMKAFTGEDIAFSVDLGTGPVKGVTLNGTDLPADAYFCEANTLQITKEYLATLPAGVYEIILYGANESYVDCFVVVGAELSEVHAVNFDSLCRTGGVFSATEVEGLNGKGGRFVCNQSGMLLEMGAEAVPYAFKDGQSYAVTMYLKFEDMKPATSLYLDMLLPIRFAQASGGYADIVYLRYNEQDGYYVNQCNASKVEWTEEGGWNRLYFEFTYHDGWASLTVPAWMQGTITVDSFVLTSLGAHTDHA